MSGFQYYSTSKESAYTPLPGIPADACAVAAQIDDSVFEGTLYAQVGWLTKDFAAENCIRHDTDELIFFAGIDPDDHENLHADIELTIGNDVLRPGETCAIFVPAGAAHGRLTVKNLTKPVFYYVCHLQTGTYAYSDAQPGEPAGKYAQNYAVKYVPTSGQMPGAPDGFLQLLLYLDSARVPGAPYMETTWFKAVNDTGPAPHAHKFDERIAFVGMDPSAPEELGAVVDFDIEGEYVRTEKSAVVYIPRGVTHSPILVPEMKTPILHFSIGREGDYDRKGEAFNNEYRPEDR